MLKLLRKDKEKARQFKKEEIPKLRYGMIHSLFGDTEGVPIVMNQIEEVLNNALAHRDYFSNAEI